jgi:hypothetical protein
VTFDLLAFDPESLPPGYLRFLRAATTAGALVFAAIGIWGYVMASRALSEKASDITAMLLLMKFLFFFATTGVSGAMALVLAIISYRCWRAAS